MKWYWLSSGCEHGMWGFPDGREVTQAQHGEMRKGSY